MVKYDFFEDTYLFFVLANSTDKQTSKETSFKKFLLFIF